MKEHGARHSLRLRVWRAGYQTTPNTSGVLLPNVTGKMLLYHQQTKAAHTSEMVVNTAASTAGAPQ